MALRMGRSLLNLRIKEAGLTQAEFANRLGVGRSFVSMVASGERTLSYERAMNAARILGCKMEDLNEWIEVPLSELKGDQ
ncbi:helix-turn-helix transcriptional regulator [Cohnella sp. GCM10020058]|uniref:helix-turn-helix transcriptional regulator n=1 Tax=Cohnella sp. GCM10020058 TaxID=3317330 RepID=UPI003641471F